MKPTKKNKFFVAPKIFNLRGKAQQQYLSWIIILAVVVGISFFLYRWSISQAQQASEDIETQTDPVVCSEIGLSIKGVCQDFRAININITNINTLEVEGLQIRTIGLYPEEDNYLNTEVISTRLTPGDTANLQILKKTTISQIEIVPIAKRNEKNIYCDEQSIQIKKNTIKYC